MSYGLPLLLNIAGDLQGIDGQLPRIGGEQGGFSDNNRPVSVALNVLVGQAILVSHWKIFAPKSYRAGKFDTS